VRGALKGGIRRVRDGGSAMMTWKSRIVLRPWHDGKFIIEKNMPTSWRNYTKKYICGRVGGIGLLIENFARHFQQRDAVI